VSISHTLKARTSRELQDMPVSLHIWARSNQEGTISKASAMWYCISCEALFLGKIFQEKIKMKNIRILKRKN